jgi:voltage-gated sodium channel
MADAEANHRSNKALSAVSGDKELGDWLFQGGVSGPVGRRLRARSSVLQALQAISEVEDDKLHEHDHWIKTQKADLVFGCVIALYGALTGIDVQIQVVPIEISAELELTLFGIQVAFMLVFLVELALRIRADGCKFFLFWRNPAGFFDTLIIVIGTIELSMKFFFDPGVLSAVGVMRVFRLLRLVRIVRVLLVCKELKLLAVGMFASLSAVFWAFVLLSMLMYLGSLVCVILLGEHDSLKEYFGSVPMGLYTHFVVVTFEAWPDISDAVMEADSGFWALYFMGFIMVSSMALMNLVTGVVCDKLMGGDSAADESIGPRDQCALAAYEEELDQTREQLRHIFDRCDLDGSFKIDAGEFEEMLRRPDMKQLLEMMDVTMDLDAGQFFGILDIDDIGNLTFDALHAGLLRLRGSRHRLHSMMLQKDLIKGTKLQLNLSKDLWGELRKKSSSELQSVGASLLHELEELSDHLKPVEMSARAAATATAKAVARNVAERVEDSTASRNREAPRHSTASVRSSGRSSGYGSMANRNSGKRPSSTGSAAWGDLGMDLEDSAAPQNRGATRHSNASARSSGRSSGHISVANRNSKKRPSTSSAGSAAWRDAGQPSSGIVSQLSIASAKSAASARSARLSTASAFSAISETDGQRRLSARSNVSQVASETDECDREPTSGRSSEGEGEDINNDVDVAEAAIAETAVAEAAVVETNPPARELDEHNKSESQPPTDDDNLGHEAQKPMESKQSRPSKVSRASARSNANRSSRRSSRNSEASAVSRSRRQSRQSEASAASIRQSRQSNASAASINHNQSHVQSEMSRAASAVSKRSTRRSSKRSKASMAGTATTRSSYGSCAEEGEEEEQLEGEEEEVAGETDPETDAGSHDVDSATNRGRRLQPDAQFSMPPPALEVEQGADSLMDSQDMTDDSLFSHHGPPAYASNAVHAPLSASDVSSSHEKAELSASMAVSRLEDLLVELDGLHAEALNALAEDEPPLTPKEDAPCGTSREVQTEVPLSPSVSGHLYETFE